MTRLEISSQIILELCKNTFLFRFSKSIDPSAGRIAAESLLLNVLHDLLSFVQFKKREKLTWPKPELY